MTTLKKSKENINLKRTIYTFLNSLENRQIESLVIYQLVLLGQCGFGFRKPSRSRLGGWGIAVDRGKRAFKTVQNTVNSCHDKNLSNEERFNLFCSEAISTLPRENLNDCGFYLFSWLEAYPELRKVNLQNLQIVSFGDRVLEGHKVLNNLYQILN